MAFLQGLNQLAHSFAANIGQNIPMNQGTVNPPNASERAARSVFVGNIPYDATDEQLKEIFSQVGQVVSFRLVYDRETGKPKGYGFCEYADQETAQSAMRNLNNHDFHGRPLRVGYAAGENKEELKSMQQSGVMTIESPYGEPVEPEKAPEAISRAVASLPPEQMFELMKQMKLCIQNNPNEARNMLLQNPQLAYALLQAQIVMKIVDPQVAMAMLYRDDTQPLANIQAQQPPGAPVPRPAPVPLQQAAVPMAGPMAMSAPGAPQARMYAAPQMVPQPMAPVIPAPVLPPLAPAQALPQEMARDPRLSAASAAPRQPLMAQPSVPVVSPAQDISAQDQEKAALIMQVLQLTDQQIAMLPPEQRQSILILKEQLTKSQ